MAELGDWLSRLLEMVPVSGKLDYRCFLGAPWRIDFPPSEPGEIAYHVILGGSAILEEPEDGPARAPGVRHVAKNGQSSAINCSRPVIKQS